jgi:hypothetical protein
MSNLGGRNRQGVWWKFILGGCRESRSGSDYSMKAQIAGATKQLRENPRKIGAKNMKYILLMSGSKAGVEGYQAWPPKDIEAHMSVLRKISDELTASGEFVATQALSGPAEAKVVRGEKNRVPVTDGVFPESKEFLLGYWIVDVASPERAYAIAGRISAAAGPGGVPTNMPIEVRRFATRESKSK